MGRIFLNEILKNTKFLQDLDIEFMGQILNFIPDPSKDLSKCMKIFLPENLLKIRRVFKEAESGYRLLHIAKRVFHNLKFSIKNV